MYVYYLGEVKRQWTVLVGYLTISTKPVIKHVVNDNSICFAAI